MRKKQQSLMRMCEVPTEGFEVFMAVVMESSIFWVIALCSLLKVNQRFGETCHLHLQGCILFSK
jgi:hypothetical protein